jgi:hypothetical protein
MIVNTWYKVVEVYCEVTIGYNPRHAALLEEEGYAGVGDLADAEDEDLAALGLKKPELKRLRKALDKLE